MQNGYGCLNQMWNGPVHVQCVRKIKKHAYCIGHICKITLIFLGEFETKIGSLLGGKSGAQMGYFRITSLKNKILMQVCLYDNRKQKV
jgi:hypothetical protein